MTDWGVPNWADPTAYPADLTLREWQWQFTRRRPDYRDLWVTWGPIQAAKVAADREAYERLARAQGTPVDVFFDAAPTDDPDGLRRTFNMSTVLDPGKDHDDWTLLQHNYSTGGVARHNGAHGVRYGAFLAATGGEAAVEGEAKRRDAQARASEDVGIFSYVFNVSAPLGQQLDRARDHLLRMQREMFGDVKTRRPRKNLWTLYLRALDARDAGETYMAIGATFWPGANGQVEFKARDVCKAAEQLRDNFPI